MSVVSRSSDLSGCPSRGQGSVALFSRRMVQTRSISAYATCAIVITIVTHPVFHPHHWKSRVSLSADVPLLSVVLLYEFDAVATRGTRPAWRPFLAF